MSKDRSSFMSQTNINNASNTVIHINDGESMQPFNDNESATKDVINVRWGCKLSPQKSPCKLKLKKEYSTAVSCTCCNRNNIFEYYYCDKDKCIMCLMCGGEGPITPPHTPIRGTNTHSKRQKTRKRTLSLSGLGDEPDNKRRKYGMDAELNVEDFDELNDYTDGMMNCLNDMKEYNYNLKKRFMEYTKNKQSEIAQWKQKYKKASDDVTDRDGQIEKLKRELEAKDRAIGELERMMKQQLYDEQKKQKNLYQIVEEKNKQIKELTDDINWWKKNEEQWKQLLDDEQEKRKQIVGRKNKEIEKLRNQNKNVENFKKNVRKWTKLGDELQLFNADD